jgi:RimJ/RimL family protein N-acetyltransferase
MKEKIMDKNITIKRLFLDDWPDLKAVRLAALKADPQVFLRRYDEEQQQADRYWQRSFTGEALCSKAIFGLYAGDKIIGMGGIHGEADIARAARLGGAYIAAPHRGQGLAHRLINARLDWARANALYDDVYVSHRAGNGASQAAIKKAGFSFVKETQIVWPDGVEDAELIYKLTL